MGGRSVVSWFEARTCVPYEEREPSTVDLACCDFTQISAERNAFTAKAKTDLIVDRPQAWILFPGLQMCSLEPTGQVDRVDHPPPRGSILIELVVLGSLLL